MVKTLYLCVFSGLNHRLMRYLPLLCFLMAFHCGYTQLPAHLEGRVSYPVIEGHPWAGVIDQPNSALPYDPSVEYKVMVDVYDQVKDPGTVFSPVSEVARTFNLIAAHGVPKDKISMAVIIHGGALDAFLSQSAFREKFRQDNPNLELIRELHEAGVKFYVCSQSLAFRNMENDEMCGEMEIALSAKTSMILLDQRGYSYLDVNED